MTKLEALKDLAAKVEAGDVSSHAKDLRLVRDAIWDEWYQFGMAYNGSLDAAKALHEAVLPGCSQYSIVTDPTCLRVNVAWWPDGLSGKREISGEAWHGGNPARAWLLAILRALIAQEDAK